MHVHGGKRRTMSVGMTSKAAMKLAYFRHKRECSVVSFVPLSSSSAGHPCHDGSFAELLLLPFHIVFLLQKACLRDAQVDQRLTLLNGFNFMLVYQYVLSME
jgi:hypothetical protein